MANKTTISEAEKIDLFSDDIKEIMGHVPPWIVRWGVTAVFIILVGVLGGSFVFKYPDVISSSVVIISENPPASIIAHSSGKIDYLFVHNEQKIRQGEILAILENTANYNHVEEIKNKLNNLSLLFTPEMKFIDIDLSNQFILGPIQGAFANFQRQYQEYGNFLKMTIIDKKIFSKKQQIKDYSTFSERLNIQISNQEKTVKLSYQQFKRDSSLYTGGVIATAEFEKAEQSYLQIKNNYQSLLASLANNQMQVNQLSYEVIDLQSQKADQTLRYINTLKEAFDNLNASISEWEKTYVLSSPIEGKIAFTKFWSKNQYVIGGSLVFTIVPINAQRIIGRIKLSANGSGKVEVGQLVHIRLDNFPYMEFGMIEGKIESISLIPETDQQNTYYTVEVSLPNGLSTSYKKILPFSQEMQGTAEIVTKNMSLFERLVQPFKAAIYK